MNDYKKYYKSFIEQGFVPMTKKEWIKNNKKWDKIVKSHAEAVANAG
jgi:hypothetical protein